MYKSFWCVYNGACYVIMKRSRVIMKRSIAHLF